MRTNKTTYNIVLPIFGLDIGAINSGNPVVLQLWLNKHQCANKRKALHLCGNFVDTCCSTEM